MINNLVKVAAVSFLLVFLNVSWAEEERAEATPKINCTLTDKISGDNALAEKDTFDQETAMIYFICISADVKPGQHIKAVWIAANTHDAAPANYKISEKNFDVTDNVSESQEWAVKYSLSKPTSSWPVGQYHVDLYVNEQLLQSTKFNIKSSIS